MAKHHSEKQKRDKEGKFVAMGTKPKPPKDRVKRA